MSVTNAFKKISWGFPAVAASVAVVLAAGPASADPNGITRFAVRNCTPAKMLVCAYDKTDNILEIPYHAKRVAPGEREKFSCGSAERCKVFMGADEGKIKEVLDSTAGKTTVGTIAGVTGNVGLAVGSGGSVTMYLIAASGAGMYTGAGMIVAGGMVGAAVGVGAVFAVTKTIDGFEVGDQCKKMMKDQKKLISEIADEEVRKKANDSRKEKVKGSWPGYKDYRMVIDNGVMIFEKGRNCPDES